MLGTFTCECISDWYVFITVHVVFSTDSVEVCCGQDMEPLEDQHALQQEPASYEDRAEGGHLPQLQVLCSENGIQ